MNKINKIMVEREPFQKDGKNYFSYFIKGTVRGKDIRVLITPPDKGGWQVLDIVFGDANEAELELKPYEMKNEATGEVIKGNSFAVKSVDENGEVYECKIKPLRSSDKMLLNMLTK
ncbi:MAG: hypothetical protein IJ837_03430 [Clostridia bacterium]|nr:hypothetical protein [Clostridia bacterium]